MEPAGAKSLEVCFSPALLKNYDTAGKIIVLVDILRATSTICTALYFGVSRIIPVSSVAEALRYKQQGFMVAGERNGKMLPFADYGNSPFYFMNDKNSGKTLVYSTTNGTRAIKIARGCKQLVCGAYLNHELLCNWLIGKKSDVIILCSGWKNKFNLEDTLFAGAVCEKLLSGNRFTTICDSVHASVDLWSIAKKDLISYIQKAAHRHRLRKLALDDVIEYCHTFNAAPVIPVFKDNSIVRAQNHNQ